VSLVGYIIKIYNDRIIALSEETRAVKHLEKSDAAAKAVSPICGSEVTIELALDGPRIRDIGYAIEACALTRAAVAILVKALPGKTREESLKAGAEMEAMLQGGPPPTGAFSDLSLLSSVRDYPSRHNALLLPFEAVEKAFRTRAS
jgi:NifU-like protein involved in Fe-S cluster formation